MKEDRAKPAWVRLPNEEELAASLDGQKLPYQLLMGTQTVPNMSRLLAAHPRIGPAFRALGKQVMWQPGHLSRAEREMIAAVTAVAQDCAY